MSEHPRAATKSTNWDNTTEDTHNEKRSLNYRSINKQPRSLNFPTPLAYIKNYTIYKLESVARCILQLLVKCLYLHVYYNNIFCEIITNVGS